MVYKLSLSITFWFLVIVSGKNTHRKNKHHKEDSEMSFAKHEKYHYIALLADVRAEDKATETGCTGAIITEDFVLTSAGCTPPYINLAGSLHVWYKNFTSPPPIKQMSKVLNSFVYESYRHSEKPKLRNSLHNIGLLQVERIPLTNYGVLSAVDYQALSGFHVSFAGGIRSSKAAEPKNMNEVPLQMATGMIVKCETAGPGPHLMCVALKCSSLKDSSTYTYDGGPIMCDDKIVGVLSGGDESSVNIGFTPVSPYLDWIIKITNLVEEELNKSKKYY